MSYQEQTITCSDCGNSFTFTVEEQEFFAQKGYTNSPKRCKDCRTARRNDSGAGGNSSGGYGRASREMFPATCAECNKQTEVPFEPRGDRPVYCSDCYSKQPARSSSSSRRY